MGNAPDTGRTVMRKRAGEVVRVTRTDATGQRSSTDLLSQANDHDGLVTTIRNATMHLLRATESEAGKIATTIDRRDDQDNVFRKTTAFLGSVSENLEKDPTFTTPMARIIQPPRTGKTILMGEIIGASGATALILVPTLSLVDQHREKLQQQLPTVGIGVLTGEEKRPHSRGITIATYDTLVWMHRNGTVPDWLRYVTFIFSDEGHESMTKIRQEMLRGAFDPSCVRIAFTATPDYDKRRALAMFYPKLISEISLSESYRLKLLAQFKVWAQVVDVDASSVRLVQGDYDREEMARLMNSGPVFETCRQVRWQKEDNASRAALICCSTRQQAHDLHTYLMNNRPAGTSRPEIILSDTDPDERRRLLREFETGKIDTLINVGVLLRGWDSRRCKLLIDLYLSLSLVRSKQKYFRPLTKDGDAEASIWLIVPKRLPRDPVLPSVVFGISMHETWVGKPLFHQPPAHVGKIRIIRKRRHTPIRNVDAKSETVLHGVELPRLDPTSLAQIRSVLESKLVITEELPRYDRVRRTVFDHPLFGGWGSALLKYCGIYSSTAFTSWIQTLYPEQAGTALLRLNRLHEDEGSCCKDAQALVNAVNSGIKVGDAWRTVFGPDEDEETIDPETTLVRKQEWERVLDQLRRLPDESRLILERVYLAEDDSKVSTSRLQEAENALCTRMHRQHSEEAHQSLLGILRARGLLLPEGQTAHTPVRDRAWAQRFFAALVASRERDYIVAMGGDKEAPPWTTYRSSWKHNWEYKSLMSRKKELIAQLLKEDE
ncbi:DEAD/DEAH box helicase family protein [Candidatus Uhrbacteria bacterium]|nr:DEAD/DEAH box helicase family protein [Candidatus Uhrbacteria bacterium]